METPPKTTPQKQPDALNLSIPWSQLSRTGKIGRFVSYIFGYWFCFVIVLIVLAGLTGNHIQEDHYITIALAPFTLPFVWLGQLLNNKTFGYTAGAIFVLWLIQKEMERLHNKLDQILEELRKR